MVKIAEFEVKVHPTKDKKKLKNGFKEYKYGTINIRSPDLLRYIGKTVKVTIENKIADEKYKQKEKAK